MNIPLVDLKAQIASIRSEIDEAINDVVTTARFIGGPERDAFEEEFAQFCGAAACAGCGNGTDALYLSLRALGVGSGDEVITVANTFIATAEAITLTGAKPVFADVRADSLLLDASLLESLKTDKTKAIVPVHLNGLVCDMDAILAFARDHGLVVVEDAAQAHGATYQGKRIGSLDSDAACFSFFPGKNLGSFGDAGAVVSNNVDLIKKIRMLCNHGRQSKYYHEVEGVNSRMDGLQAAILRVKLRHLDDWTELRRKHAQAYTDALSSTYQTLRPSPDCAPAWHLYPIRHAKRDQIHDFLDQNGIATGIHYPVPLHQQPAYQYLGIPADALPVTTRAASELLSIPIYPELQQEQQDYIIGKLSEVSTTL